MIHDGASEGHVFSLELPGVNQTKFDLLVDTREHRVAAGTV